MLKWISILQICLGALISTQSFAEQEQLPHEIIQSAANSIASELEGRKDYLGENKAELYALIDKILVPHFDMRYAGRLALGKHWKTATPEQRDRFIEVFYEFLLQSYANGVLKFEEDAITVFPVKPGADDKRVVVNTQMKMDDGSLVPVNYSMRKSSVGWRVYDVRIEGVSYIQNYRNQFNAEISAVGLEAVIERLLLENKEAGKSI